MKRDNHFIPFVSKSNLFIFRPIFLFISSLILQIVRKAGQCPELIDCNVPLNLPQKSYSKSLFSDFFSTTSSARFKSPLGEKLFPSQKKNTHTHTN